MSRTHPTELDPLIDTFQHDSHRPRAAEALIALKKIASMVKPIMRRRNWRVGTLCEFYPQETNLLGLNINRNEKICLRLRHAGDEAQFVPFEQVVDTMLHELCHYVHGPHNAEFHALWNQLRDEHESLVRKGYSGEGFLGRGERLGGARIPLHEAKRRARIEAERRKALTAGSGQKLGGQAVLRGTDIRQVIAAAAQRRINTMKGCASGTDTGRKVAREVEVKRDGITTTKAEYEDENEAAIMRAYIDLIQEEEKQLYGKDYVPPSESNPAGPRGIASPPPGHRSLLDDQATIERTLKAVANQASPPPIPFASKPSGHKPEKSRDASPVDLTMMPNLPPETWTCDICTLDNPSQFLSCDACGCERPPQYNPPSPPPPVRRRVPNDSTSRTNSMETSPPLKPRRNAADSLARIREQETSKPAKPMGWTCLHCRNWMEQQWWTCAACGNMKTAS